MPGCSAGGDGRLGRWGTTRRGWSSTTPTRTSWNRRAGCATTPIRRSATASPRCATRAATSCARPVIPTSSSRDLDDAFEGLRGPPRQRRLPGRRGGGDHEPQELRRHRLVRRRGPAAALDLLGFASQLVFNTFHNRRLRNWEHSGDLELAIGAARAHNRGMVEFCSVDPRLLPSLLRPAGRHRPGRRAGRRGDRDGRRGAARRLRLPADPLPQPRRPRPGVGGGQRGRHPDRVPRRRHRRPHRPELLPQRPAHPARLPRRRGELPLGRLHGHPRPAGPDAGDDDLRRRARALPRPAHRRHRAGRHLGCRRGCARWSRRSTPSPATRSACRPCRCARASTSAGRSASRRTPPRTSAGSSTRPARRSACSRPTTPTSRAAGARSSASRRRSPARPTPPARPSTTTTSST